jgi:hypothetical protein
MTSTEPPFDSANYASCNTLSGGSAAFIIIALVLGTLAQPPGSLLISTASSSTGYWRIWRLSSFFCGLEGLTIFLAIVHAPCVGVSQRKRAFTIMAQRTTAAHDETRPLVEYLERPKLELILPMMLQIWKVIFIRGSGLTTVLAALYWLDWAVVQYCHCWVCVAPLTEEGPICRHTATTEGMICQPDWGCKEEIGDNFHEFIESWTSDSLVFILLIFSPFSVLLCGSFFIEVSEFGKWSVLVVGSFIVTWVGSSAIGRPLKFLGLSGDFTKALHKARFALFEFGVILAYYKLFYKEAGTYKPAWLDWFG